MKPSADSPLPENWPKDWNAEDEGALAPSIVPWSLFFALLALEPALLWALGLCEIESIAHVSGVSLLLRALFFVAAVHVMLIGPVITFAYPEIDKLKIPFFRQLALLLFLAPPILAVGYFFSQAQHSGAIYGLVVPTLVLLFLGVLLYDRTRSLTLLSLGTSTLLYFRWALFGDILGPFKTAFVLIPKNDLFYWAETGLSVLVLGLGLWKTDLPVFHGTTAADRSLGLRNRTYRSLVWLFLGGVIYFVLPWCLREEFSQSVLGLSYWDLGFLGLGWVAVGDLVPRVRYSVPTLLFKLVVIGVLGVRVAQRVMGDTASLFSMTWVLYDCLSAILVALTIEWKRIQSAKG